MEPKMPYMTIKKLTESLNEMAAQLESGDLQPQEIADMNDLARQLYERLVVLHFKAFEAEDAPFAVSASSTAQVNEAEVPAPIEQREPQAYAPASAKMDEVAEPDTPNIQVEESHEPELPASKEEVEPSLEEEERPTFHFGTPQAPKQISLIDSIEEIKRMESSINDQFKEAETKTLSHKLKQSPIADLKSAIGINMRFQFTTSLFGSDAEAYSKAIDKLNAFSSFLEADEYIHNNLKDRFDWQMKNPVVKQFLELVERRYI